jgi:hypothetical protein
MESQTGKDQPWQNSIDNQHDEVKDNLSPGNRYTYQYLHPDKIIFYYP